MYAYPMSMSSTRTASPQTKLRSLRKLLNECMTTPPPICAWVRATRTELKDKAKAEGGQEAASYFSQEKVAARVGVSLKAYRAFEDYREPSYERRLAIARALGLREDYFEVGEAGVEVAALQRRLAEEVDRLSGLNDRLEARLGEQELPRPERKPAS